MFCSKCGIQVAEGVAVCPACGASMPGATAAPIAAGGSGASPASHAANVVKAASQDAIKALKGLAGNPVAGLAPAYESLGEAKALSVGIAFGVVSLIFFLLGGFLLIHSMFGMGVGDVFSFLEFGGVMKLILFALMPFVSVAVFSLIIRKVFAGAGGGLGGDCFIAGTAVLPLAIIALLTGIIGMDTAGKQTTFQVLNVFAGCISILILFAGYTRITKISERLGTIAVPLVIVLSVWLTYEVFQWVMQVGGTYSTSSSRFDERAAQREYERAMRHFND